MMDLLTIVFHGLNIDGLSQAENKMARLADSEDLFHSLYLCLNAGNC